MSTLVFNKNIKYFGVLFVYLVYGLVCVKKNLITCTVLIRDEIVDFKLYMMIHEKLTSRIT